MNLNRLHTARFFIILSVEEREGLYKPTVYRTGATYSLLHDMHAKKSHALYSGWVNEAGTLLYLTLNKEEPRGVLYSILIVLIFP